MKKSFSIKRIILLLSLILAYTCAFFLVKTYAQDVILKGSAPSSASMYIPKSDRSNNKDGAATEPAVTIFSAATKGSITTLSESTAPISASETEPTTLPTEESTLPTPVATTSNPDEADSMTSDTEPEVTTAEETTTEETTTEATTTKVTTTKATTAKTTTTKATTKKVTSSKEDIIEAADEDEYEAEEKIEAEDANDDTNDDEDHEELNNDEQSSEDENIDPGVEMTPEDLVKYWQGLGGSTPTPTPIISNPGDNLVSSNSYKNQTLTIYDKSQGRYRTENAFDLVCEITNYEVGSSLDPEAIKAQAVAIYSYVKFYEQRGDVAEIGTKGNVPDIVKQCVEAVDGLAMYYDGKYIMAAFSSSTGGYSASCANVWGGDDRPYLTSVFNEYDYLDEKYYGKTTTYTVDEVRQKIESKTDIKLSNNYSEWIKILSVADSIYADKLSIDGRTEARINGKTRTITGYYFRTYILSIRSTAFTVSYSNGVFTFTTYGNGHGVGMSQIGAHLYAKHGNYTFDQILHHYYTGVTIK